MKANTFYGALSGNATSATKLQARTIGGVSFNGTSNIDLPGVNQGGNQNTSGNAASATKLKTARTIGGVSFNGTSNIDLPGVNQGGNQDTTGNAATATSATNASNVYVAQENTNDTRENRFLTFVDGTDDNKQLRSKSALYYKQQRVALWYLSCYIRQKNERKYSVFK